MCDYKNENFKPELYEPFHNISLRYYVSGGKMVLTSNFLQDVSFKVSFSLSEQIQKEFIHSFFHTAYPVEGCGGHPVHNRVVLFTLTFTPTGNL